MNNETIEYNRSLSFIIEKFCSPLIDCFNISLFWYFKLYKDGFIVVLSNRAEYTAEYCSKINSDVIYFQKYIESYNDDKLIVWPRTPTNAGMEVAYNLGYWHGFTIAQQNFDNVEGVCFVSRKENSQINNFYIKHHQILRNFANYFKYSFSDIIHKAESYKAQLKDGCSLYIPEYKVRSTQNDILLFMQTSGINRGILSVNGEYTPLTGQEKKCLYFINQGFSLKEISRQLLLSPKTIEIHLKNIRNKTGYHNKKDLIKTYREALFMENEL